MVGFSLGFDFRSPGRGTPTPPGLPVWYVSNSGDDFNSGRSPSTPFATIGRVMSEVSPGDTILFERDSYFRDSLLANGIQNITVGAYGTGRLPTFDCADILEFFIPDGTLVDVYTTTVTVPSTGHHMSCWEDGVRLTWVDDAATVESTPGSFYADPVDPTTFTLYIHASDSSDPETNGKLYEGAVRLYGVQTADGWVVSDIRTRRNLSNNGSFALEQGSTAIRCVAEDGVKHNFIAAGNTVIDSCIAYKSDDPTREGNLMFVAYTNDGSGQTVLFKNCLAVADPSQIAIAQSEGTSLQGFYAHTTGAGSEFDHVKFEYCSASNLLTGFGASEVDHIETEACYAENVGQQFLMQLNTLLYTSTNDFINLDNSISGAGRGCTVDSPTYVATGLRTYTPRGNIDGVLYLNSDDITISESTFYADVPSSYIYNIRSLDSNSVFNMTDCLFVSIQNGGEIANAKMYNPQDVDRNVYSGDAADFEVDATNYSWVEDYLIGMQGNGLETSGFESVVTLTNPSGGDFSVASATPGVPATTGVQDHSIVYTPILDYATIDAL